jgi:hypothetical protein
MLLGKIRRPDFSGCGASAAGCSARALVPAPSYSPKKHPRDQGISPLLPPPPAGRSCRSHQTTLLWNQSASEKEVLDNVVVIAQNR